jgi:hypothetical protein
MNSKVFSPQSGPRNIDEPLIEPSERAIAAVFIEEDARRSRLFGMRQT